MLKNIKTIEKSSNYVFSDNLTRIYPNKEQPIYALLHRVVHIPGKTVSLHIVQRSVRLLPGSKSKFIVIALTVKYSEKKKVLRTCVVGRIISKAIHNRKNPTSGPNAISK